MAYKHGQKWATDEDVTAKAPAALELSPDRAAIQGDGLDLCFVTVRVTDETGVTVPRADNPLKFKIEGPGEIVATDNGDPRSFEPFPAPQRKAFNGLCLVIVRAKAGQAGRIQLTASGDGLKDGTTVISSAPSWRGALPHSLTAFDFAGPDVSLSPSPWDGEERERRTFH